MTKTITDSHYCEHDDIWTHWFTCPECDCTMVMLSAGYCQECGVKLKWDLKDEYK
jgi:hypothetical protein